MDTGLSLLALHILQEEEEEDRQIRLIFLSALKLEYEELARGLRTRVKLHRCAIPHPEQAAINTLLDSTDDSSWIALLGFHRTSFEILYSFFKPAFEAVWMAESARLRQRRLGSQLSPPHAALPQDGVGAQHILWGKIGCLYDRVSGDCRRVLALVLFHTATLAEQKVACMIFGVTPSTLSNYLSLGLITLHSVLQHLPEAAVTWPSGARQQEYASMIRRRYTHLTPSFNPFAFLDGLNLPVKESGDPLVQNATYNGWLAGCYVSNIFVYAPDGTIIWARVNMPGSWHDALRARTLLEAIADEPGFVHDGLCIVADTAFPRSADMQGRLVTPKKQSDVDRLKRHGALAAQLEELRTQHTQATTVRQAAEWGMRQLQSGFARLRVPLPLDMVERQRLISTCVFLHNLRVRQVGLSQIRTVYSAVWQQSEYIRLSQPLPENIGHLKF